MSDNGQQVPLIERLRSVPAAARVLEHTPNPLGYDTASIPVGALCREAADRIAELERERDQYHDPLIARHGGEPVALLAELDEARARIAELEAELERERMRLAACGVVAMANTRDRAREARQMLPEYRSASLDDVERAVDREMAERERREAAENLLLCYESQDSGAIAKHFARYEKEPT